MKFFLSVTIFLSFSSFASINFENTKLIGETNFLAVGKPAMIKIKGHAPAAETKGRIEADKIFVVSILNLNLLDTGIELRDEHMKEKYLETRLYPEAVLTIEGAKLPAGFEAKPLAFSDYEFSGKLKLHGKEQKIIGTFSMNESLLLVAHFSIKLSEFNINIPSYLGINVTDTVAIDTKVFINKK